MEEDRSQTLVFEVSKVPSLTLCTNDDQGMLTQSLESKPSAEVGIQNGTRLNHVQTMNHTPMTSKLMEHVVEGTMVQIVDGPLEQIVDEQLATTDGQIVNGSIGQIVPTEMEPTVEGVIEQMANGVPPGVVKKEEILDDEVEEDALEAELDNDLLDEEEEEDDEVQIKQEKGRKLRSRRKKKRKLTFIPRKLNRIYQCDQCPAMFARDTQLKYHAKVHVDQTEKYECDQCHVVFSRMNKLMKHRQHAHQEALSCDQSSPTTNSATDGPDPNVNAVWGSWPASTCCQTCQQLPEPHSACTDIWREQPVAVLVLL
ncbi:hypothetical protein C7M84_004435 [Penaeus vannamei]|uniref:C2H2-type domain-containing protein n=1 Tax=Penaeus vannamei TaxID=6689 RepID=A0A3R7NFL2_PENVA|nr:hypothetical protein C7M84_004435 [Penaeus vannamei]